MYYPFQHFMNDNVNENVREFNFLLINDNNGNSHLMYVSDAEKLTCLKFCPICG
jgi:hypothetical protein